MRLPIRAEAELELEWVCFNTAADVEACSFIVWNGNIILLSLLITISLPSNNISVT